MNKNYNRTKLHKNPPYRAVLIQLLALDLHIKYPAAYNAVRICRFGCWIAMPYGHSDILDELPWKL